MNRFKSLNKVVVIYIFTVMLFAGVLTSLLYMLLYLAGASPVLIFTPVLSPVVTLVVSIVIGTLISAAASEMVLKPINHLIKATRIISTGDFTVRVGETGSPSEIASLLKGFNKMAEELGSIEMFRNDFINNFSHEIRSPIVSITGFARQLQNEDLSAEKRMEYTDIIISELERVTNMSTNILLLSNYENQQIITNRIEYELDEQIRNCVILLEKRWSSKNLDIDINLQPVKVFGNPEMLSHLWLNILDNAIKYSDKNGRLSITGREDGEGILVSISDNGKGMDEAEVKHIFEKFYQGDKSHAIKGNGLGLSIAGRVVELHGGTISGESELTRGSTFRIFLPGVINRK